MNDGMMNRCWRVLSGRWMAVGCMAAVMVGLMLEGTWGWDIHHHPLFVLAVLLMMLPLGAAAVRDICSRRWHVALSHGGLLLVLAAGLLSATCTQDVQVPVAYDWEEHMGYTRDGRTATLPFSMRLCDFRIERYEDGVSPKQYTSVIELRGERREGERREGETSVNHPMRYHGWWIYQADYDHEQGEYVVLKVVRDPWLPLTYIGFALLALGALADLTGSWHNAKAIVAVAVLTVLFTAASLARVNMGHLPPALRSLWFFPHILIYMVAYSLMALALVLAVVEMVGRKAWAERLRANDVTRKMLRTTSALLLIGMLCGAVWAKACWGHYWTWDAKENWAAVTWMFTLLATHVPLQKNTVRTVLLALAFAAMQVTWYGVNYLPAAQHSLHTYNRA